MLDIRDHGGPFGGSSRLRKGQKIDADIFSKTGFDLVANYGSELKAINVAFSYNVKALRIEPATGQFLISIAENDSNRTRIRKYDTDMVTLLWEKVVVGSTGSTIYSYRSLEVDEYGNVYTGAWEQFSDGLSESSVVKISPSGTELLRVRVPGQGYYLQYMNGHLVTLPANGNHKRRIYKAEDLALVSTFEVAPAPHIVAIDKDGSIIRWYADAGSTTGVVVEKYDATGVLVLTETYLTALEPYEEAHFLEEGLFMVSPLKSTLLNKDTLLRKWQVTTTDTNQYQNAIVGINGGNYLAQKTSAHLLSSDGSIEATYNFPDTSAETRYLTRGEKGTIYQYDPDSTLGFDVCEKIYPYRTYRGGL